MKPTDHVIRVNEESPTGVRLFVPYCNKQGCHWIGEPHLDKTSAQSEGAGHPNEMWLLTEVRRLTVAPRAIPAAAQVAC